MVREGDRSGSRSSARGGGASGLISAVGARGKAFRRSRRGRVRASEGGADAYLGPSGDPLILRGGDLRREETGEASAHGRVARERPHTGSPTGADAASRSAGPCLERGDGGQPRDARGRAAHLDGVVILDQRVDGRDRHDGAPTVSSPGPSFSERRGLECAPTRTRLRPSHFPFDERFAWRRIWRVRKSERVII